MCPRSSAARDSRKSPGSGLSASSRAGRRRSTGKPGSRTRRAAPGRRLPNQPLSHPIWGGSGSGTARRIVVDTRRWRRPGPFEVVDLVLGVQPLQEALPRRAEVPPREFAAVDGPIRFGRGIGDWLSVRHRASFVGSGRRAGSSSMRMVHERSPFRDGGNPGVRAQMSQGPGGVWSDGASVSTSPRAPSAACRASAARDRRPSFR